MSYTMQVMKLLVLVLATHLLVVVGAATCTHNVAADSQDDESRPNQVDQMLETHDPVVYRRSM